MTVRLEDIAKDIAGNMPRARVGQALQDLEILDSLFADERVKDFIGMIRGGLDVDNQSVSNDI